MSLVGPNQREQCGTPFEPRSRSGGSVQRFCCTACRLGFHKERLRRQRRGLYAGRGIGVATIQAGTLAAPARARNRRRADRLGPARQPAAPARPGSWRRSRALHLPRLLPAVPGNSRCAPRSDRGGRSQGSGAMSKRKRTVSLAQWAALAGLGDDGRSVATARALIRQGEGPEVVPVNRKHRTDTGVQLGDHRQWLREKAMGEIPGGGSREATGGNRGPPMR